ncbi:DNA polymerase Y family protein [Sphaerotilus sp.]|uniref:Y-family DNA polymerase n=1 Tax=Sphaerotilus sp. TaxID=2093942 RepID=UPI00286DDEE2|nr:DNA polymerase Y family protein [Sphaerotilus sp.]
MPKLWYALRCMDTAPTPGPSTTDHTHAVIAWALQFTPRVTRLEEAVAMEVAASVRLFGGAAALQARLVRGAEAFGAIGTLGRAPTSLAALALARAGRPPGQCDGEREDVPLPDLIDPLPLHTLSAAAEHAATLGRLGCRRLGDVRRLPRGGLHRRFGPGLGLALDRAYGLSTEGHDWVPTADHFEVKRSLEDRVDTTAALLAETAPLFAQLDAWLTARQAGVCALTLHWHHDALRARTVAAGDALQLRTGAATRDLVHLGRLLGEHLQQLTLAAPVDALTLRADEVVPLVDASAPLLPEPGGAASVSLGQALECIAARFGPERVCRPVLHEDHRLEGMQHWQPGATLAPLHPSAAMPRATPVPQPTWVLAEPVRLAVRNHRPCYQGPLQLLIGPHRVEAGWWHGPTALPRVQRDYWVAFGAQAGVLWIYQERPTERTPGTEPGWFLQGHFA